MTLDQAICWIEIHVFPEHRKVHQAAFALLDEVRRLQMENAVYRTELAAISKALDDPRTDLYMTMVDVVEELVRHKKELRNALMNIAYSGKTKSGMKEDALRALGLKNAKL